MRIAVKVFARRVRAGRQPRVRPLEGWYSYEHPLFATAACACITRRASAQRPRPRPDAAVPGPAPRSKLLGRFGGARRAVVAARRYSPRSPCSLCSRSFSLCVCIRRRAGQTVSPLLVPSDLAKLAQPIWAPPAPPAAPAPPGGCAFKDGLDCINDDFKKINGSATDLTQEACCRLCHADPQCKVAVLVPNWHPGISLCELKSACSQPSAAAGRLKCCLPGDESCSSTASPQPQFAMARAEFNVSSTALKSAVAFVTAQQSPFAQPDTRLATTDLDGDYGASIPSGGSSQARLLGAYKLHVNGIVVGVGPGRRVNQTQGVDAIDILSALRPGDANAVGIQGFHTSRFKNDDPRLLFLLKLEYTDGTSQTVGSGAGCQALAADHIFNPDSSQGAWAGGKCAGPTCSGMPQENLKLQHYPFGWSSPGFAGTGWSAATVAKPFVLPLQNRPARPVAVYERTPLSVTPWTNESCTRCFLVDFGR